MDLKEFLDEKADQYNNTFFIEKDPVFIPHQFSKREDIEISGFLAATIAWGQRPTIINNGLKLMNLMDGEPHEFILNYSPKELKRFENFCHRTFNSSDLKFFIKSLRNIYKNHGGLHSVFQEKINEGMISSLIYSRKIFFKLKHERRSEKHYADVASNAAAKRLNMFLRWMVRKDKRKIDFGIWNDLGTENLYCPLDVHSARVARKLGLLERKQNDLKAVVELTNNLKQFDPKDPVKYDYALFGLGVFEKF
ncbi:MAG: TIGR02757 family protein [Nitrosopumilus sp.]|nr:TIGR02757 family protein [Nitrosopumilus sp.]